VGIADADPEPHGCIENAGHGSSPDPGGIGSVHMEEPDLRNRSGYDRQAAGIPEDGGGPMKNRFGLGGGPEWPIEDDLSGGASRQRQHPGRCGDGDANLSHETPVFVFLVRKIPVR
jgi:hypothetical protein